MKVTPEKWATDLLVGNQPDMTAWFEKMRFKIADALRSAHLDGANEYRKALQDCVERLEASQPEEGSATDKVIKEAKRLLAR